MLHAILGGSPRIGLAARGGPCHGIGCRSQDIGEAADQGCDPVVVIDDPLHRVQQTPGGADHLAGRRLQVSDVVTGIGAFRIVDVGHRNSLPDRPHDQVVVNTIRSVPSSNIALVTSRRANESGNTITRR